MPLCRYAALYAIKLKKSLLFVSGVCYRYEISLFSVCTYIYSKRLYFLELMEVGEEQDHVFFLRFHKNLKTNNIN